MGTDKGARLACPLWVISGHHKTFNPCPLYPRKRTLGLSSEMSALCQKRTHAPQQNAHLFDHLVGEREQERRNLKTQRLGGPDVEIELELRWSHNRQGGRICAIENQTRVDPGLSVSIRDVGAIAHQAPSFNELSQEIDRGKHVILAFKIADLAQTLTKCLEDRCRLGW